MRVEKYKCPKCGEIELEVWTVEAECPDCKKLNEGELLPHNPFHFPHGTDYEECNSCGYYHEVSY